MNTQLVVVIQTYPWQCMECKTCIVCRDPFDEVNKMTWSSLSSTYCTRTECFEIWRSSSSSRERSRERSCCCCCCCCCCSTYCTRTECFEIWRRCITCQRYGEENIIKDYLLFATVNGLMVRVRAVVLRRTVAVKTDRRFNNLSGCHLWV